jgi:hypothetical protein
MSRWLVMLCLAGCTSPPPLGQVLGPCRVGFDLSGNEWSVNLDREPSVGLVSGDFLAVATVFVSGVTDQRSVTTTVTVRLPPGVSRQRIPPPNGMSISSAAPAGCTAYAP